MGLGFRPDVIAFVCTEALSAPTAALDLLRKSPNASSLHATGFRSPAPPSNRARGRVEVTAAGIEEVAAVGLGGEGVPDRRCTTLIPAGNSGLGGSMVWVWGTPGTITASVISSLSGGDAWADGAMAMARAMGGRQRGAEPDRMSPALGGV